MEMTVKFILCKEYDFEGNHGISCKCFDTKSQKIISVKTNSVLPYVFGDDVVVEVVPNGNYITYTIA